MDSGKYTKDFTHAPGFSLEHDGQLPVRVPGLAGGDYLLKLILVDKKQ